MELVHQRYMTSGDPDTMMTDMDEAQMLIRHIGEAYITGTVWLLTSRVRPELFNNLTPWLGGMHFYRKCGVTHGKHWTAGYSGCCIC